MIGLEPSELAALDHVIVLAPYRRDADYLGRLLEEHDIRAVICAGIDDLIEGLSLSPGVVVATHEALTPPVVKTIADHLGMQPAWSEIPIIVLLDRTSPDTRVRAELQHLWPRARQLFYKRPVTPVELVSGVQSALLARLRQRDVRDHIEREIELRRELNHRVKNILASVASIFEVTQRRAHSIEALTADFRGRLDALSKVHSAVFEADDEIVSIEEIVGITFEPYNLKDGDRIVTSGPPVMMKREAATTLALCLHELTTNAIKYGALSTPEGRVSYRWALSEDEPQNLSMSWRESGGPTVREPARIGYGTRYLRSALAGLLGGKPVISFHSDGLRCDAHGPVSRVSRTPSPQDGSSPS